MDTILKILAGGVVALLVFLGLSFYHSTPPKLNNYYILFVGEPEPVIFEAEEVRAKDGCVEFLAQDRVTAVLCIPVVIRQSVVQ